MTKPANPTCKDCRHECVRGLPFLPFIKGQWCAHPLALDRVTGRADTPCALMRGSPAGRGDPKALCGAQGRNWEARERLVPVVQLPDPVTAIVQRFKPR